MKEYNFEDGKEVNLGKLETPSLMPREDYARAQENLIIPCHDVIIKYEGGALLIKRKEFPARDIFWPIGGRILRGVPIEESLRRKAKDECNLDLDNILELNHCRGYFSTDNFGHGKGTDVIIFCYYAEGKGELKLNDDHKEPTIVRPTDYTTDFKAQLHPYVKDSMDEVIEFIQD